MPVRMYVADLIIEARTKSPVVILRDGAGSVRLPIFIGLMEAGAIAAARESIELPRPMTHDLLVTVVQKLGGTLEGIEVTRLEASTFFAELHLRSESRQSEPVRVDCRPSDAIALALRVDAPIWVREVVLEEAGLREPSEEEKWRDYLESLDPDDFGGYKM